MPESVFFFTIYEKKQGSIGKRRRTQSAFGFLDFLEAP